MPIISIYESTLYDSTLLEMPLLAGQLVPTAEQAASYTNGEVIPAGHRNLHVFSRTR